MEEFPASNLTYWDVSQQTYLYVQTILAGWVWSKGDIHPLWAILDIKSSDLRQPELTISQQHFPSKDIFCFLQISQPAKIRLKNKYFEEQIHWVPLGILMKEFEVPLTIRIWNLESTA